MYSLFGWCWLEPPLNWVLYAKLQVNISLVGSSISISSLLPLGNHTKCLHTLLCVSMYVSEPKLGLIGFAFSPVYIKISLCDAFASRILTIRKGNDWRFESRICHKIFVSFHFVSLLTDNDPQFDRQYHGCHYKFSIYLLHITWMWINNTGMYCFGSISCCSCRVVYCKRIDSLGWLGLFAPVRVHGVPARIVTSYLIYFLFAIFRCVPSLCCCCFFLLVSFTVCLYFNFCIHPISI